MAHRILTQVIIVGGRVLTRAFAEAWKQASASSRYAAQNGGASARPGTEAARTLAASGMTMDEACRILHVRAPAGGAAAEAEQLEPALERFKRLFDANDPKQGGSFYLQSKILRARERIELEVREAAEKARKEGGRDWPKVYKERGPAPPSPRNPQTQQQAPPQQQQQRKQQ